MVNGNDDMNPQSSLSKFKSSLVVSLTDSVAAAACGNKDDKEDGHGHHDYYPPTVVGGKASSLAKLFATEGVSTHVPKSYALTVSFFHYWIEELQHTADYQSLVESLRSSSGGSGPTTTEDLCKKLQEKSWTLAPTNDQSEAIQMSRCIYYDQYCCCCYYRYHCHCYERCSAQSCAACDPIVGTGRGWYLSLIHI